MSNLETVRAIYAAFQRGDRSVLLDALDDDVEWEAWEDNWAAKAGVPTLAHRRGKAGVEAFFEVTEQMDIVELQVLRMMEGDGQVAVEFVLETNLPTWGGGHYRDEEIHLFTFDERGKIVRVRNYVDTAKHIAAFGLQS